MLHHIFFSTSAINTCLAAFGDNSPKVPSRLLDKFLAASRRSISQHGAVVQLSSEEVCSIKDLVYKSYIDHIPDVDLVDVFIVYRAMLDDIMQPMWGEDMIDVK